MSDEEKRPADVIGVSALDESDSASDERSTKVPMSMKILSVLLVSLVGFGSHWSTGVTGAMKSTLKKELHINNAQYATLDASENFIKTALILVSGIITDRFGGARTMLWGNAVYSIGAILIAAATQVRSFKFMIAGSVVQALGDVATQCAQYKVFSSWFAPSNGFASTLGFELGLGKIGGFVGKASANVIAKKTGDFSWVYWCAVFINLFTNVVTFGFYLFTNYCERRFAGSNDPATGERLTEKNKKFEITKMLRLPWPFWLVSLFSLFQTSVAGVFSTNATEFAQKRFNISAVTAGWYSAMSQYLGFFLVPILGIFIDIFGQRNTIMLVCGLGMLLSMCLAAFGPTVAGTAASFGIYAFASSLGPTVIIDAIRTSMWYQEVFGSGYAIKIAINNSMTIIIGIVAGVIQDHDNDGYDRVIILYVVLAAGSVVVGALMFAMSFVNPTMGRLQWTRKQRIIRGEKINALKEDFEEGKSREKQKMLSISCFAATIVLLMGAWATYFWGVATGHND
ncbi:major facilitator superfamily domain-containing protein [Trichoderma novae-zelandiae]